MACGIRERPMNLKRCRKRLWLVEAWGSLMRMDEAGITFPMLSFHRWVAAAAGLEDAAQATYAGAGWPCHRMKKGVRFLEKTRS